jgi:hypothetical protein
LVVVQTIAYIASAIVLLLIFGLASFAFRGGERAGYPEIVGASAGEAVPMVRRRTSISAINQFFVWGLALTLTVATVALIVATLTWDGWAWP